MTDATAEDVLARRAAWSVDVGDCLAWLKGLPDACVQCCVTSPPYFGLRDYGPKGQIGLEDTPEQFVASLVAVFAEVRRVLRPDGLCWLNLGDSYARGFGGGTPGEKSASNVGSFVGRKARKIPDGVKGKDLLMVPAQVALALRADGWYLRSEIIWSKKSPMPESVRDRCTRSHEMIYMLSKGARYYYDQEAERPTAVTVRRNAGNIDAAQKYAGDSGSEHGGKAHTGWMGEPSDGRNLWSVWDDIVPTPFAAAHFATFPEGIPRRCLRLGSSLRGCCPACGSPWRRVVEREKRTRQRPNEYVKRTGEEGTGNSCANTVAGVSVKTTGWAPSCDCPAHEPVPCVVMDPFTGSGTTGAVARDLGMRFLGVDLNGEYAAMARRRIGSANPLLDACDVAKATKDVQPEPTLFGD